MDGLPSPRNLLGQAADFLARFPGSSSASSPAPADGGVVSVSPTYYEPLSGGPSCPIDGPVSCRNDTTLTGGSDDEAASCCYIAPSGRMLLTQFWDREVHAGGAEEDFTLHGLWPDLCDGTYKAFCGMTPHFNNITDILVHYGHEDLVKLMDRYWIANYGTNEHLWAHEYNKHASCINTLAPACYDSSSSSLELPSSGNNEGDGDDDTPGYRPGVEVVDYFTRAFGLFRTLDSYQALARAGITPSWKKRDPLAEVQAALEAFSGGRVVLRCNGHGRQALHEVWYVFFVQGSLQTGEFVPAQGYGAHGDVGNCADDVWYFPKVCRLPGGCDGPGSQVEDGEEADEWVEVDL